MRCYICKEQAEFSCPCEYLPICRNHIGHHIAENGHNTCEILNITISNSKMQSLNKELLLRINKIEVAKAQISSMCKKLIEQLEYRSKLALDQLNSHLKFYLTLFNSEKLSISLNKEVETILETDLYIRDIILDIDTNIQQAFAQDLVSVFYKTDKSDSIGSTETIYGNSNQEKDCNQWQIKDKQSYMENLGIQNYQEWFARNGLKKRLVIEIRFSSDGKFAFVCNCYVGKCK